LIVWVFFLVVPTNIPEEFSGLQLAGFIIMVLGTLIYNEVIVLHTMGFDEHTKEYFEKKKLEDEGKKLNDSTNEEITDR